MINPMINFAMNLLQKNPNVANNPNAQEMIRVIQSGDERTGVQIAENLCRTYGVSREEATDSAMKFFGIK